MTFIVTLRKYKGSDKLIKAYFKNVNLKKNERKKEKSNNTKKENGFDEEYYCKIQTTDGPNKPRDGDEQLKSSFGNPLNLFNNKVSVSTNSSFSLEKKYFFFI